MAPTRLRRRPFVRALRLLIPIDTGSGAAIPFFHLPASPITTTGTSFQRRGAHATCNCVCLHGRGPGRVHRRGSRRHFPRFPRLARRLCRAGRAGSDRSGPVHRGLPPWHGQSRRRGPRARERRGRPHALHLLQRPPGLRGEAARASAGRHPPQPERRAHRARPGGHRRRLRHADPHTQLGPRPHRSARPAAGRLLHLRDRRRRRHRLRHRHRHPAGAQRLHRPRDQRLGLRRQRRRGHRLRRPRHPRGRDHRRDDVRCGEEGAARGCPRPRLQRQRHHVGRDRRRRLGHSAPCHARRRQHVAGRRPERQPEQRRPELDREGRGLRRGRGQQQPRRLPLLARVRAQTP